MPKIERKLSASQRKCNVCEGDLRELSTEEKRMIKTGFGTGFDFPRGIYICNTCNQVATIGLTTIDMKSGEWTEIVENLSKNDLFSERDSVDKILETVSFLPELRTTVVHLGYLFKCEGKGVGCSLYKVASCGRGQKQFCPGGWCNYDPYPQEYKRLFWHRTGSTWPKNQTNVIDYWFDVIINKTNNVDIRIDAINRIGTISIQNVSKKLCDLFYKEKSVGVREVILVALSKQKTSSETERILHQGLGYDSPASTQLLLLKQLRTKHNQCDIVEMAKRVSCLTTSPNEEVKEESKKTLQLLKRRANKEKPDLKMAMASAKD